jgi:hypothetical protein
VNEAILALLADRLCGDMPRIGRVCGEDSYIPLGPAANEVLPTEDKIIDGGLALVRPAKKGADG